MQKAVGWIDIEAPCQEVFDTVTNLERRMQLSPLWGLSQLLEVSPDFPKPGSSYRVRVLTDAPFGIAGGMSNAVQSTFSGLAQMITWRAGQTDSHLDHRTASVAESGSSADEMEQGQPVVEAEQEYFASEYQSPNKLSYYLDADCKTIVTWRFQSITLGTSVNYEEVFCAENGGGDEFIPTVQHVIHEWLNNIKRYAELRGSRGRSLVKWFLDRFFLRLRPDQRRTVLLILFLQGIGFFTFVLAAIALGVAAFLF